MNDDQLERIAVSLERIARALEQQIFGVTAEDVLGVKPNPVGCPACAPVPEGPEKGPGCEQCGGYGYVFIVKG